MITGAALGFVAGMSLMAWIDFLKLLNYRANLRDARNRFKMFNGVVDRNIRFIDTITERNTYKLKVIAKCLDEIDTANSVTDLDLRLRDILKEAFAHEVNFQKKALNILEQK